MLKYSKSVKDGVYWYDMRNLTRQIYGCLGEFSGFRPPIQETETKLPLRVAIAASWIGVILIYLITKERLAYLLIPVLVAFPILNRSGWHRNLPVTVRSVCLGFFSFLALGTAILLTGFLAILATFFVVAINGGQGPG